MYEGVSRIFQILVLLKFDSLINNLVEIDTKDYEPRRCKITQRFIRKCMFSSMSPVSIYQMFKDKKHRLFIAFLKLCQHFAY